MRPEKYSLQSILAPGPSLTKEDLVKTTKRRILNIGDHIEKCLEIYVNLDKITWRTYLWSFVPNLPNLDHLNYRNSVAAWIRSPPLVVTRHVILVQRIQKLMIQMKTK